MRLHPTAFAYGTWKQCHAHKLQYIWLQHAVGDEAATHCLGVRQLETMSRKQATIYLVCSTQSGMRLQPTALAYGTWKQCHANKLQHMHHAVGDETAPHCLGIRHLETMSRKQATIYLVAARSRGCGWNRLPWRTAAGNNVTQTSYNIFGCSMQSGRRLQPTALAYGSWRQCYANKLQHIWLQHAVGEEATSHCLGIPAAGNNVTQTSYNIFGCSTHSGMRLQPTVLAYGSWKQCHANKLQHIWLQHAVGDAAATDCLGVRQLETMSHKQATKYLVAARSRVRLQPTALAYGTWKQCHANKLQHI